MLNAVLRVVGGKQDGKIIPLSTRKFLIGREQDCHLRPGSESVSRHHCAISIDDFTVRVRDLGSSNGTFINGTRVLGVHDAQPGDRLKIGALEFDILFSQVEVLAGPAEERGDTAFSLDEFSLPDAGLSETAIMGGDTAIIPKPGSVPEPEPLPEANPAHETAEIPEPELLPDLQAVAGVPASIPPQQTAMPGQYPPGVMPGMQPPGYPYGMPQPMMPQPGYPPMMPQAGYPYGMPQPGYPYGMPQPGYGMPGMMPQYGMPYPQYPQAMSYPGMAPAYAPQPVEAPEEEEVEEEGTAATTELPVVLPDPATTGFKEAPKPADGAAPAAPKPNPAADILKKMQSRR